MDRRLPRRAYLLLAFVLAAANVLVYKEILADRTLSVRVLPAGKGIVAFVTAPSGRTLLVNAGSDASILRVLGETLSPWQRSLDGVILTSVSARTAGGAPMLLHRYRTPLILRPEARGTRTQEAALESVMPRAVTGVRGMRLDMGGGAYADILWPPQTPAPMKDGALALRLVYGHTSFLIYDALPSRVSARLPLADQTIASSSAPALFISDGRSITKTPSR